MEKKDELSQEQTIEVSCPYCGVSCDMWEKTSGV